MFNVKQGLFDFSKKLFLVFFTFMLMGIFFTDHVHAEPVIVLKLQVEEPAGSGIWKDTGVARKTGESARYRVFYSISDTEGNSFKDAVINIKFPGGYDVLSNATDLILPSTVDKIQTSSSSLGNKPFNVNIIFKNPTLAGVTGSAEFTVTSRTNSGPDGLVMTPEVSMTGTIVKADNSTSPLVVPSLVGPSWTVKAETKWQVTKSVLTGNPIYVPAADAYQVDYEIIAQRTPYTSVLGSWGETSVSMVDQLPNIPGLTPEVVFAKRTIDGVLGVYNSTTKTVTWPISTYVTSTSGTTFRLRVKYPKSQLDALGGTNLTLTNKARVESTLIGGVPYVSPEGTVSHKVSPSDPPTKGMLNSYKSASIVEILGTGLDYNDLSYYYSTGFILSGDSKTNYRPKEIEFIDEGIKFTKTDSSTYTPTSNEWKFTSLIISSSYLSSVGGNWQISYRTSPGGAWIDIGAVNATSIIFPEGTVAWRWVVKDPDYAKISAYSMFYAYGKMGKRTGAMPLLKQVDNTVTTKVTYPDNTTLTTNAIKPLPVKNDRKIVTRWYANSTPSYWVFPTQGGALAPGRQAVIAFDAYVDRSSSVVTKGANFFALLPPELTYNSMSGSLIGYLGTTVIPNYKGTGKSLVKIALDREMPAMSDSNPIVRIVVDINPMAALTTYDIPTYFAITPAQAKDASIDHSAVGGTAYLLTDTYDLDEDGDSSEKLAGRISSMTLGASNAANVAKLSKGPYDTDWKASGTIVEEGQEFQYRIFFRNDSSRKMKNLVMIDVLPRSGDVDPLTNTPRNSAWQPILKSAIIPPVGGTVYYSTSTSPNMSPVVNNGWTGTWSTTPPGDLSTVRAVKIDFGSKVFAPGDSINTYFTMKVPTGSIANNSTIRNTVNFAVDEIATDGVTTSPLLPATSSVTEIKYRVPNSTIGDFVWADVNINGLQDAGEVGVNGLKVELYGAHPITGVYSKLTETTTSNHPTTGKAGYYLFEGLRAGKYYLQFPGNANYVLTTKNVGTNRNIDSDVNADGKTDIIDLADDTNLVSIDAGYTSLFPVSGTLYYDIDANGAYDDTKDRGISSYTVSLKNSSGTVIQTTTTDANGAYSFLVAGAGTYTVEVNATTLQSGGFKETEPILDNVNSITTKTVTLSTGAMLNQNFGFKSTNTVKAKVIWDTNKNDSIADATDKPLENIKIKIWDLTDNKYLDITQVTNAQGEVTFTGVFLDRSYRLDIDMADTKTKDVLKNLISSINQFNNIAETPIDGKIVTGVLTTTGLEAVFGYKSKDTEALSLTAYTYIDAHTLNAYDAGDLVKSGVAVKLIDKETNLELESGITDSNGKYDFVMGLADGRAYQVTATTPTGLQVVYNYASTVQMTPVKDTIDIVNYVKPTGIVRFGYRSDIPITITSKVSWDVNHNDSLADAGIDQMLQGVSVKLMNGSTVLATKTTNATGDVSFNENDGLVIGGDYKLVVDKAASGNILTGLVANINMKNAANESPIDDEVILTNLQNNDRGIFGYKSKDSNPNPSNTAKLNVWGHLDIAPLDQYNAGDILYSGLVLKVTDVATGFVLESGTTDGTGKKVFTYGLAEGRSYQVEATTPSGLKVVYNYLDTSKLASVGTTVAVNNYQTSMSDVRYGYRSATALTLTGQVMWDVNANGSVSDAGMDQKLAGVTVKLMSGTTELATATTDADGKVTFTDLHGLVVGQSYQVVVDKTVSGAVMTGLIANINQKNGTAETPIDDAIVISSFVNNDTALLGYKSQDAVFGNMPKLTAYTHVDVATPNAYDATDLVKSGVTVQLIDTATGFTLENGITDTTGKYSFTIGLAEGRTYKVISTTPSDLTQTYAYLGTSLVAVNPTIDVTTYSKPETIVRYGYKSKNPITITGKVVWDVNHNDSVADNGIDKNLANVTVKLMSGTTVLGTKVTDANGLVTFNDTNGLVIGNSYKLVVDKSATGAVLTGLNANINQKNGSDQAPIDDEIILENLQNNDAGLFGYKSQDSDPNSNNTAKLPAWAYLDIAPMDQHNVGDIPRTNVSVQLLDVATGLTIQTGTTTATGVYEFNQGLANGRAYQVISTTPSGLQLVYSYLNGGLVTPVNATVAVANYDKTSTLVRYGYRSSAPVTLTGKVIWDTNHNDSTADSTDQVLAGVSVKLMHGTDLLATSTTNASGVVTFTDAHGLVVGESYKLVVDKTASGTVLTGLNANVNLLNNSAQSPSDDEIIITTLANNDAAIWGYKSKDSDPNPDNTAKISTYTYIDIPSLNSYDPTDLKRAGVSVKVTDTATGLVLETGTTDSSGKYTFTYGVAEGRAYQVEATTPAGLGLVYSYLESTKMTPVTSQIAIASYSKPEMTVRYGYKSTLPVSMTTQVIWDVNHNGNVADSGIDQNLSGVSVKLMNGTVLIATKPTGVDGKVTFTQDDGLVAGENYKVVVDKVASGAVLAGLSANVNQLNSSAQAPVDDEIILTGLANNDAAVFGYKSDDSDPNPNHTAKLTAYAHIDLAVLNQYDTTDLNRSGVAVQLIDQTTGFTLQTGTTDATGKFVFTYGLSESRSYKVKATTPTDTQVVYNYQDSTLRSPAQDTIALATYTKPDTLVRFGYRSDAALTLTSDVKWQIAPGETVNLANVKVKLMSGTIVLSEKTTDANGHVSFDENEGLIVGDNYKLVVDKGQTPAIFMNLVALENLLGPTSQAPIDDEITINGLANNQNGTFVYAKDPAAPAAGLKTYSHLDITPVGSYSTSDPAYPAIAVKLKDIATGLVIQNAVTDAQGEFVFTQGVISGRSYEVEATTPSGLSLTYGYLDTTQVTAATKINVTNLTGNQLVRYGYGSSTPIALTGKVIWDVNHNGTLNDSGTDRELNGISVKLMNGSNLLATKTTNASGEVIFNEADGLVIGKDYKLIVDKTASGAVLTGLEANVNQRTGVSQTPIDDEILLTNLQNNEQGLFGYKSQNSDPNPNHTAKLNAWGYLDATPLDQHNVEDIAYAGLSVKLTDVTTGFVLQTGTTDNTGKFIFVNGLADGRSYQVEATTPTGLKVVYNYLDTAQITPANAVIVVGTYASTEMNVRYGYRSATALTLTGQVMWDTNANGNVTDSGIDQKLVGVTVKLMSGTTELATATTNADGKVTFTDLHGLVVGQSYKIVVDKAASAAVMTSLVANINQINGTGETPIDDTVSITSFVNNNVALLGYKSQDAVVGNMPKLTAYTHVDVATPNVYDTDDLVKAGVAVQLIDTATGFTLESGITDTTGKYSFTIGLAEGRTYQVVSTTPSDLTQTYAYLGTTSVTVNPTIDITTYTKPETIVRYGYKSTNSISITGKVVWDVNHNDSLTDSGIDKDLAGVKVKLMSGATVLETKTTDANGQVTFTQDNGLVIGNNYKLVVDKTATGAVLTGLNANVNQKNGVSQSPINDEITLDNLQNNDTGLFGYKSQDSDPNPNHTAKLPAWAYLDISPMDQYSAGDIPRANVGVKLVDVATGFTLQTGTTTASGLYEFNQGLANGRAYRVESTTPSGLELVYSYLSTNLTSPINSSVTIPTYDKTSTLVRYGYRSSEAVALKAKVVWDTNHNDSVADSTDQVLAGVTVKLMHGTNEMATAVTNASGEVTFTQVHGLVTGESYTLVVNKTASGTILTGLNANVNLMNNSSQAPVDDEIVVANLATNDSAIFGYKSQDSDPNPNTTAKLTAYTHLDLPTFNSYDPTDLKRAGVSVKVTDTATGLVLETGTTDSTGKYTFTFGLANGRSYQVEATSPSGLDLVYSYLNTSPITPVTSRITIASYSKPEMIVRYGYKSTLPVSMTAQVIWDVNHNDSVTDSGVDKNLPGVSVKLMSGTVLIATKTTGTDGKVTFTEADGLVNGEDYKVLVDKTASGAVLAGLIANINQMNDTTQTPIDDEIMISSLSAGSNLTFGYKSEDSNPNPSTTSKLTAYTHIDLAVLDQYDTTDLNRSGISVALVDMTTGFTLETGTTDGTGKYTFTYGLTEARSYKVQATTPTGMQVVYNYQNTTQITSAQSTITVTTYSKPETLVRFGYRSNVPLALTGDVKWETAPGVTVNLANVKVKLMSGTTMLSEKTTDSNGHVSFDENEGLIVGDSYKLVVDKAQTPAIFINLTAAANLLDTVDQTPIDDEITISSLTNNQNGTFIYGQDSTARGAELKAYTHLDVAPIGTYSTLDQAYPGTSVTLKDVATGLTIETGLTNAQGEYIFTRGVVSDRAYEIEAATPSGMNLTYTYRGVSAMTVNPIIEIPTLTGNQLVRYGYQSNQPIVVDVDVILNNDGNSSLTDSADTGIGAVNISLSYNGVVIATKSTDSNGNMKFTEADGLVPGWNYVVQIDATSSSLNGMIGHINFLNNTQLPTSNSISLPSVTSGDTAKFGYQGNGSVSGYVTHDLTAVGFREDPDIGLDNLTVTLTNGAGIVVRTATTDTNGFYNFEYLPGGQYTIDVERRGTDHETMKFSYDHDDPPFAPPTSLDRATVTVASPTSRMARSLNHTEVNFGYLLGGSIEAVVYKDANNEGSYNPNHPRYEGVEVILSTSSDPTGQIRSAITDANGEVRFINLDPTKTYYLITKYGATYAGYQSPLAQALYVTAGTGDITRLHGATDSESDVVALKVDLNSMTDGDAKITDAYFVYSINNHPVTITKIAGKDSAMIGDMVPYTIKITNNESKDANNLTLNDLIPPGFKYVAGSGRYTDSTGTVHKMEPTGTRPIAFTGINVPAGKTAVLRYILVVGAGVTPGDYINKAHTLNAGGFRNSNIGSATVRVTGDPLFDDSLIFGKVFHDINRNGRQDKNEAGIGGVKLVTARGEIITTDEHGRYHLADVSGGRWERGTNFILKLDTRSLPQGLTTTTENPIVVRLSPGLPSRINFGVEVPPPVAARLAEQLALAKAEEVKKIEEKLQKEEKFVVESIHFAFDQDRIEPEFENTLDSLAEVLRLHPEWKIRIEGHTDSLGTEAYNRELSQRRANAVKAYLLKTGVNSAQLVDAVGLGLSEPVADNATPEGRYKNRRVEFKLEK